MKDSIAGDIATAEGGVGGTGDACVFLSFRRSGEHGAVPDCSDAGICNCGSALLALSKGILGGTLGACCFPLFDDLAGSPLELSSASDTPYRSSNSVTSVMTLCRCQESVLHEEPCELSSPPENEADDGEDGRVGALMKWRPLGVGNPRGVGMPSLSAGSRGASQA